MRTEIMDDCTWMGLYPGDLKRTINVIQWNIWIVQRDKSTRVENFYSAEILSPHTNGITLPSAQDVTASEISLPCDGSHRTSHVPTLHLTINQHLYVVVIQQVKT